MGCLCTHAHIHVAGTLNDFVAVCPLIIIDDYLHVRVYIAMVDFTLHDIVLYSQIFTRLHVHVCRVYIGGGPTFNMGLPPLNFGTAFAPS